jgi:aerobic-type carbon monoxide dehydrogenase small subunit (CoxS/CutS family)
MKRQVVGLTVNGEMVELLVAPQTTLLEALREELSLTGVKEGCSEGVCGACTVLLNGAPVRACLTPVLEAEGADILTIEGLATSPGALHPLQKSFIEHGAVQCGFCTPGMILASKALLDTNPAPKHDQIKSALAGNFCRCTGYAKIIEAVKAAASTPCGGRGATDEESAG